MVEAMARKDYAEADRIIDTCKRKRYEVADLAYTEGFRCVHLMAMHARVMLLEMQSIGMATLGLLAHLADRRDEEGQEEFSKWCDRLMCADANIQGIWLAWERFCAEVGVDADKAFSIGWSEVPDHFKVGMAGAMLDIEPPEVDEEAYKRALDLFSGYWERVKRYA
jgi:hypothetical protein